MAKDAVYQAFGKKLAELTADERTLWRRAVRMASYYRKHERNKAQQRKDKSWRKLEILGVLGWPAACSRCGYDRYIGALDFHHIDPDTKVGEVLKVDSADAIDEARKCELLCANCHREEHAKMGQSTGRPSEPMHPQVAAYLRAVGVTRPGDVGRLGDGTVCEEAGNDRACSEPSSRSIVLKDNGGAVGERLASALSDTHRRIESALRHEDDRVADYVEHVEGRCVPGCVHCPGEDKQMVLREDKHLLPGAGRGVCRTSGTAQCTCPPNGICNDCTIDVALW